MPAFKNRLSMCRAKKKRPDGTHTSLILYHIFSRMSPDCRKIFGRKSDGKSGFPQKTDAYPAEKASQTAKTGGIFHFPQDFSTACGKRMGKPVPQKLAGRAGTPAFKNGVTVRPAGATRPVGRQGRRLPSAFSFRPPVLDFRPAENPVFSVPQKNNA